MWLEATVFVLPRVLVVHNRYRSDSPSGENQVVDAQIDLLREAGLEVETYLRSSDEIADFSTRERVALGVSPIHSRTAVAAIDTVIKRFRPDIVHVHNVYPLISPAVVTRAQELGCRVVQTVHNFRHVCASGTFFRDGSPCTDCQHKLLPWPAVQHGCYRGSRPQSIAMGLAITRHRRTWLGIDRFLPVSAFVADFLEANGVPRARIKVVPNSVADPGAPAPLGEGFVFVGRLSREKGVPLLLDAWDHSGLGATTTLTIAGDGPEREAVERAAERLPGIRYVGPVDAEAVRTHMRQSRAVVIPSVWFEALPTVVLEAYASGRPIVAARFGALEGLVPPEAGWLAPPNLHGLSETLHRSRHDPGAAAMGESARRLYLANYAPEAGLAALLAAYEEVLDVSRTPGAP